ncbi:MAG: tripartite tricarboxylate transporter substrate binding protein [Eubacteriales bacterium]
MKNKLAVLLATVMVIGTIAGCGSTEEVVEEAVVTEETAEEATEEVVEEEVTFSGTIRIIVPYDAGGGVYNAASIVAAGASEILGTTIEVVCMSGNGGQEGIEYVYNQQSDGYTLLATDYGPLISTAIEEDVIYELDEFTPIMEMTEVIPTFFVNSDSPYETMEDLIAAAIENPNTISVAHGQYHSVPHLPLILLSELSGASFNEVATSGGSEALAFTLGGSVDVGASVPSTIAGSVESGDLRVLAVASDERVEQFPDAPTLLELGYEVSMPAWYSIFAKSDVPANVMAALEEAMLEGIALESTQTIAEEANVTLTGLGSADSLVRYNTSIESLTQVLEIEE